MWQQQKEQLNVQQWLIDPLHSKIIGFKGIKLFLELLQGRMFCLVEKLYVINGGSIWPAIKSLPFLLIAIISIRKVKAVSVSIPHS